MKKTKVLTLTLILILSTIFSLSASASNAQDWQIIETSSKYPVTVVSGNNIGDIFYASGEFEFAWVHQGNNKKIHTFNEKINGIYPMQGMEDEYYIIVVLESTVYKYSLKNQVLEKIHQFSLNYYSALISCKIGEDVLLAIAKSENYISTTVLMNLQLDTLLSVEGIAARGLTKTKDGLIISGIQGTPIGPEYREMVCIKKDGKFLPLSNHNLMRTKKDYIANSEGNNYLVSEFVIPPGVFYSVGTFKAINNDFYHRYHTGYSYQCGWTSCYMPPINEGHNLALIGGIQLNIDELLLFGEVKEDRDGNITSVRGYNLQSQIFNNEGVDLGRIHSFEYIDESSTVLLGGDGKIYIRGFLSTGLNNYPDLIDYGYKLTQNYPNPFNPETKINFQIPTRDFVLLKIFDITGKEITTLVSKNLEAGSYEYSFNASGLTSGIYFYTIQAGEFKETKRMVLVK